MVGFVVELGSTKVRLARRRSVGTRLQLANGLLADAVGERRCPMAGRALANGKVAGPHAGQLRVVLGSRAGGLLDGRAAAGGLVLGTGDTRPKVAAHRVALPFDAAQPRGVSGRESRRCVWGVFA